MLAFFTKHAQNAPAIERFMGIVQITSRNWGHALLVYAIQEGNVVAVRRLLSETLVNVNAVDTGVRSPLIHSVLMPSVEITLELLENGADVHFKDEKNRNALWYAVKTDNYEAIEHLLKYDAVYLDVSDDEDLGVITLQTQPSEEAKRFHKFLQPHESTEATSRFITPDLSNDTEVLGDRIASDQEKNAESKESSVEPTSKDDGLEEDDGSEAIEDDENDSDEDDCGSSCSECFGSTDTSTLSSEADPDRLPSADRVLISRAFKGEKNKILKRMMMEVSDLLGYSADPIPFLSLGKGMTSVPSGSGSPSTSCSQPHARSSSSSSGQRSGLNQSKRPRRRSSNGATNGGDEDEEDNPEQRNSGQLLPGYRAVRKVRRFACPYFVRYPGQYRESRRPACSKGKGWTNTHRLKYGPTPLVWQS
jgi:hypothetical protein